MMETIVCSAVRLPASGLAAAAKSCGFTATTTNAAPAAAERASSLMATPCVAAICSRRAAIFSQAVMSAGAVPLRSSDAIIASPIAPAPINAILVRGHLVRRS